MRQISLAMPISVASSATKSSDPRRSPGAPATFSSERGTRSNRTALQPLRISAQWSSQLWKLSVSSSITHPFVYMLRVCPACTSLYCAHCSNTCCHRTPAGGFCCGPARYDRRDRCRPTVRYCSNHRPAHLIGRFACWLRRVAIGRPLWIFLLVLIVVLTISYYVLFFGTRAPRSQPRRKIYLLPPLFLLRQSLPDHQSPESRIHRYLAMQVLPSGAPGRGPTHSSRSMGGCFGGGRVPGRRIPYIRTVPRAGARRGPDRPPSPAPVKHTG